MVVKSNAERERLSKKESLFCYQHSGGVPEEGTLYNKEKNKCAKGDRNEEKL
jgi:hypothetical protein